MSKRLKLILILLVFFISSPAFVNAGVKWKKSFEQDVFEEVVEEYDTVVRYRPFFNYLTEEKADTPEVSTLFTANWTDKLKKVKEGGLHQNDEIRSRIRKTILQGILQGLGTKLVKWSEETGENRAPVEHKTISMLVDKLSTLQTVITEDYLKWDEMNEEFERKIKERKEKFKSKDRRSNFTIILKSMLAILVLSIPLGISIYLLLRLVGFTLEYAGVVSFRVKYVYVQLIVTLLWLLPLLVGELFRAW